MKVRDRVRVDYEREHRNYEKRIRPLFLSVLRGQVDRVVNYIELIGHENVPLDTILAPDVFIRPMVTAYEMVGITSARREYYFQKRVQDKNIQLLINEWGDFLREFALNYAYRISNELNESTKNEIRKALEEGYNENMSTTQLISYIRKKVGNQISRFRATLIARTESTTASNLAKEIGAKSYFDEIGEQGYQQWISRLDERTRHDHFILNDTVIPMNSKWSVGNELADMPGDTRLSAKQRIQCRCTRLFMSESLYNRLVLRGEI